MPVVYRIAMARPVAVVVGIGPKNGAAFVRAFHAEGYAVAMLSRSTEFSTRLASELGDARAYAVDASDAASLIDAFVKVRAEMGDPSVLVYNAGSGSWRGFDATSAEELEHAFRINALGLMVAAQQVLPAMRAAKRGSVVVVGATASLRGKPMTTAFAAGKAAQRSLAQSMARQFWPEGVHVSLLIVDGQIADAGGAGAGDEVKMLDPNDIASAAVALTKQPRSAWSFEIDLRPKNEPWLAPCSATGMPLAIVDPVDEGSLEPPRGVEAGKAEGRARGLAKTRAAARLRRPGARRCCCRWRCSCSSI
jgi:short-subunit dehydrogenase